MRSRRFPWLNPLVALAVLLPLLAWGIGLEQTIHHRRLALAEAQGAFGTAIALTRAHLTERITKVATDNTLTQNLDWKLEHSLQSDLAAQLARGDLDQLSLVDRSCKELGRASLGHFVTVPCPFAAGHAPAGDGFFWLGGEKPALGRIARIATPDSADIYALGLVELDSEWLTRHEDLKARTTVLGLVVGGTSGTTVQPESLDAQGHPALSLRSTRNADRLLLAGAVSGETFTPLFLWPCLALAFLFTLLALLSDRSKQQATVAATNAFVHWCQNLVQGGAGGHQPSGMLKPDLALARDLVGQALQLKSDALHALTEQRQVLEQQLQVKNEEIQTYHQRLAELAELDSLAIQLQRTTESFLAHMSEFHGLAEDLSDVMASVIAGQAQGLFNLLDSWRHGVAERGARKFLRGLSETPGMAPDTTLLDEQLQTLAGLAGGVSDISFNASSMAARLVDAAAHATRIAGLWHGLARKSHEDKVCASLFEPVQEAQSLIRLEKTFALLTFSNLFDAAEASSIPSLPRTVWVSALYHIYLAMAELAQGSPATVASRLRCDDTKVLLVIQAAGAGDTPLPKRGERQAYHMEIARRVLGPFNVTLVALPALDGPFPVVLSWPRHALQMPVRSSGIGATETGVES